MFYYNFVNKCNSIGKSPSAVAEEIGFKRSVVTSWKNGRNPHQATLQKIATYFGCTIEDLVNEKPAPTSEDGLTEKDLRLLNWFRSLPKEKQKAILISQDAPEGLV